MTDNNSFNRRSFIKSSLTGATGAIILPFTGAASSELISLTNKKERKVIYRTLGNTGIRLPIISMGVMRADNPNLIKAALNAGVVHLDTAHYYQGGRNEEMLGKVLKDKPRDSFVIATKVLGEPMDYNTGLFTKDTSAEAFLEKFYVSLKRLNLEYVDILYLHNIHKREAALFEPIMKALETAKKEGKAKHIGISTHRNEPEVIQAAIDSNFYEVVLTSYNFMQGHKQEVKEAIAKAAKAGLGVVAMKTMAGGFMDRERTKPVNASAALKWALSDENVHTAIPGFTSFDQMEESLQVMEDITLTEMEKEALDLQKSQGSLYCNGCEVCLGQCPKNLPIPDLMRSYMYTYGYKNLPAAHELLTSLNLPENICSDCSECNIVCTAGFDIPTKIKDVVRLKTVPQDFIV